MQCDQANKEGSAAIFCRNLSKRASEKHIDKNEHKILNKTRYICLFLFRFPFLYVLKFEFRGSCNFWNSFLLLPVGSEKKTKKHRRGRDQTMIFPAVSQPEQGFTALFPVERLPPHMHRSVPKRNPCSAKNI